MASKNIIPLLNRVLIRRVEVEKKTASGILLPGGTKESKEGVVAAVGSGAVADDGKLIPMTLKEGDTVILPDYGGTELQDSDGNKMFLYREDDILAKVE